MSDLFDRKRTTFGYFVNLDERGVFDADVRNMDDQTVLCVDNCEIDEDGIESNGEIGLVQDGHMKHGHDLEGLTEYAVQMGVIPAGSTILPADEFETFQAQLQEEMAAWMQAFDRLCDFDPKTVLSEIYEDNDDFPEVLTRLIDDFEYFNHAHQTLGDLRKAIAQDALFVDPAEPVTKKSSGMRVG